MSQKTLDGKTDCREEKKKGTVRFWGKNKAVINLLEKMKEENPCFVITINNQKLEEKSKIEWKTPVDKR
jgi:hypothetical protein